MLVVCPHCLATKRVPEKRLQEAPSCGRRKKEPARRRLRRSSTGSASLTTMAALRQRKLAVDSLRALLVANIRDMTPALATRSVEVLRAGRGGLLRDLRVDPAALRRRLPCVSSTVSRHARSGGVDRYVDLSYRAKTLAAQRPRRPAIDSSEDCSERRGAGHLPTSAARNPRQGTSAREARATIP